MATWAVENDWNVWGIWRALKLSKIETFWFLWPVNRANPCKRYLGHLPSLLLPAISAYHMTFAWFASGNIKETQSQLVECSMTIASWNNPIIYFFEYFHLMSQNCKRQRDKNKQNCNRYLYRICEFRCNKKASEHQIVLIGVTASGIGSWQWMNWNKQTRQTNKQIAKHKHFRE